MIYSVKLGIGCLSCLVYSVYKA
uniref:Uncharacterized protein n=1 Tax=Solanum lycopersicum TaxID=4081 RepID=A0A3Q7HMW6_SOLLC